MLIIMLQRGRCFTAILGADQPTVSPASLSLVGGGRPCRRGWSVRVNGLQTCATRLTSRTSRLGRTISPILHNHRPDDCLATGRKSDHITEGQEREK